MTFLPIAERELRVSARGNAAHRLRALFAIGAVTIAGAIALFSMASRGALTSQVGMMIFATLKWGGFALACGAGTFLTADCVSEEKRDGTLGLLFLTDLRGYDVVVGKLFATSLRCFYSLLAIFPVMALSFILGGVAAEDFRHTIISLCNTVFFSLALGMVVSVLSRDAHKSMTATLTLMAIFLSLVPELDSFVLHRNANRPALGLLSPLYAIVNTDAYHSRDFWMSTLMVHLAGWCFLVIASLLAPTTWHEKGLRGGIGKQWRFPFFDSPRARARRRRLLEQSPVCWIISRDRWAPVLARLAILLVLGVLALSLGSYSQAPAAAAILPATPAATSTIQTTNVAGTTVTTYSYHTSAIGVSSAIKGSAAFRIASSCATLLSLALEFWLAAHVTRFYVDGKRNGLLELLLVTPMKLTDIVRGHWLALRKLFPAPMAAQLFLNFAIGAITILALLSTPTAATPGAPSSWWTPTRLFALQQSAVLGISTVAWVTGLFAIAWVSIWMGLASKKINVAMLKTFCYAKILPWFGVGFVSGLVFMLLMAGFSFSGGGGMLFIKLLPTIPSVLMIGVNFALIRFARNRVADAFSKWTLSR